MPEGTSLFASRTLLEHLGRGVAGLVLLGVALATSGAAPWLAGGALLGALLLLRGCPLCWTVGLVETAFTRRAARRVWTCSGQACVPGAPERSEARSGSDAHPP